ncbi:auxin-responsive protein SAUR68-like [Mercurialis annua]|uniref:auxin-responsive protein SAUR68-like n=1 Tax=Mercurialis annua TaxID=3986 RepID=UPI0024AF8FAA|nr:auxin-responsive protein SAUR68-like [Mercurialis annua]
MPLPPAFLTIYISQLVILFSTQHRILFKKSPLRNLTFNNRMISTKKKSLNLANKWQIIPAISRKRIAPLRVIRCRDTNSCSTSAVTEKGRFVVYSADRERFSLPLAYLNNEVIRELFDMAEEEFGLPSKGPLTLPCDAEFMRYIISLIKRQVTRDVQRALLISVARQIHHGETKSQILVL